MVRPITLTKPAVQPQKVNASANAAQVARLEAQAAQLREQIRLANRMGERDWAAQARQELAQVNTQLNSLQPPAAAPAAPGVNVVNASNGTSGNGTTVVPALYVQPDLMAPPSLTPVKLDGSKPEDNAAEATTARNIVNDVTGGKSIDQIASARGMTREQVIAALRSGGMTVSTTDPNSDVQTTKITDASGRTVTQYYDYQHDSYYTSVQQPNCATTMTPVRDGLGRKETSSYNSDTGAVTTRYEDDLGTGTVTERTSLPNGASVETVTPGAGLSLPVTTVIGPDGRKTILATAQDPGGTSTQTIKDGLAEGKSIEQVAQENGLTSEQVIAELQAAGYQVKTQAPTSDNGDVQSVEIVDPHSGDKTVYSHDYQHDARTVTTTADGKETSHSVDGNGKTRNSMRDTKTGETTTTIVDPKAGTETKIVTDKDGRVTTTTTEKINGGKPVEYEVKPGDNLTLIAEQYGVTLDDLRRTNPELFDSPRDPDIIHPGEKITIENGTRTTVEVTFNGYTLTTKPDGSMTLHNNTTGTDLKIEAGSTQEALARTLLAVNPNSSDPKEAKEGEVVKTFVEGLLAGEALPALIDAAEQAGQDKTDLMTKYGPGTVIEPKLDGENRVVDPFGDPPQGNAPSGGKWTPMKIDGVWTWVDPQVAQAIITENIALSRITETRALAGQRQEQFNVHMLDPAYKEAVDGAQTIINKALAPHGLQWTAQKPKGTLADAQARLTKANTLLQNAQDARGEYENAGRVLADAIAQQGELTPLIDPNAQAFTSTDNPGPDRQTQYAQGLADHANVDQLFSEVGLHLSKGDKLTIDFLVGQAELNGVPTDSKEYQDLKALQTTAGSQLELAQAYQDYFDAHANATQVGAQQTGLEQRLLAEYNSEHQFLFEQGKKHQRVSGDYLGLFQSQKLEIRDGQVWVVNQFEEGTTEQQLTYSLSEKNVRDEYRDRQLNKDWQQLLGGANSSGPVCTANGLGAAKAGEEQAAKTLNDVLDKQIGNSITDLNSKLTTLQTNFNNALTEHGPGTVDAPAGTLPDGVQPVEIDVGGQTIKVAPEIAQKYNEIGIDALTQGGKAVWIDLDTQDDDASGRWVDPELAVAKLKLDATRLQITQAEVLRRVVQGFSDYHELRLSDPSLLADRNSTVDKTYLDEHGQQTLDGIYQPKFQQLLASGYDNEFREQVGTDLEETVSKKLGVNGSTEEGREAIENVTEEIRDIGGDNPYVRSVPIFYVDDEVGTQQAVLFAVRDGDGNTRYVDVTGKKFDDLGDFQDNNNQFGENGKLVVPKGLEMKAGDDGKVALEVVKARNVSVWDKVVDPLVGIGTGIATILSFTPAAPVAAPLAYTGAAYLGTRAVINQVNHLEHGGEWDDTESLMNVASVATTVLPMASSGLRTIGMAGREMTAAGLAGNQMTRLQAFRGSIGATRSGSPLALETRTYMQSTAGLNKVAWSTDVGSVIVGAPLLATSAYDLVVNGDQMNGLQLANALTGLGTGITGTGLGIHGLRTLRPGTGTQASSNGPGANPPPGSGGAHQQPPGGKGSPPSQPALGPGPSGRPMNVYEAGADGVYRPTGEQVFHDPSHPVIQGEVIKTDDASGDGPTMPPAHDPHGSTPPVALHPADGDPIVVPGKPTGKDGSVHLVWDPETRSFTGMPEPDTSGYVYTSGKDVTPPPHYRDTDPGGKPLSLEQLAARYQKEKEYYSSRELDQRYGDARPVLEALSETQLPEPADGKPTKQKRFGDFRVSALGRVRINTEPLNAVLDLIPGARQVDLGSPTWRSYMVGIGRQTNFRAIGQAVSDGVKYKSAEPLRGTLGEELGISIRPNEHRNVTAAQLKLWPAQRQIAFQYKGSDLLDAGRQGLFGEAADSAFVVVPRSARLTGPTAEGANVKSWGVDLTFSLALRARPATLKAGERDFLHVPADGRNKFMQFEGDVPYKKVYQEDKYYLPSFIGVEQRYEVAMNATVPKDTVVVSQFVDENQGVLGRLRLRAHFVVNDERVAKDLVDNPDMSTIRGLVESGQIDPDKSIFYVPGSSSGMRQSAVPGLPLEETIVNYSGKRQRVWNAQSSRLEVILNEKFFNFLPSPDRILLRKLPAPFSHYTPSDGSIYFNLFGKREAVAATVDRTLALSAPALRIGVPGIPFLQLPFALRGEIRFFHRTQLPEAAPIVAKSDFVQRDFVTEGELPLRIAVPRWLHELDARAAKGGGIAFPKGGRASLEKWLDEIETTATPRQKGEIAEFRETSLPLFEDETFIPAGAMPALRTFLMGQAKPVEAPPPEFAYLISQDLQAPLVHWYSEQGVTETQRQTWYVNRLGALSGDGAGPASFARGSDAGAARTAGRQGDLNYLRDGSITVDGRTVDAAALKLPVASDAFLVIAEKADLPGVDRLVRDIESHPNYRRGQDVVLFVCGGGTRENNPDSFVPVSLARTVAGRLGGRVQAVDGDVHIGETIALDGSALVELPGLPVIDVTGGRSDQQPNYDAQRRYWLSDGGRGVRVDGAFDPANMAHGAKVDGRMVDGRSLGAEERKMLEAAPPTTYSLQQVRNMRQPEKWKAGEIYTRELNGSNGEVHFPVEANPDGPHPVLGEGGRYVDAPVFKSQDVIEAIEVKTYHRWTTINGVAQMREVPLTPKLQEQINKDVALRNENPAYQPRWVFLDAPPSAELQRALDDAGIVGNIFGHNKPAAATPQPHSATTKSRPGRTMLLEDESGKVIIAAMLGTEPRGPELVYVPPSDGPRAPTDAPEVADKTHILMHDPNTGEPVVLPWIRGASDDHVPGSLPEEGSQPANAAEEASNAGRSSRGNVGPYVFRADTRSPGEVSNAGGFSPPPPTGIWVDNPQGIALSNYVMGNTHGRFVGTSQSVSGAKTFVAEESRAARQQGYTYLYTLNPSRPRLHVPIEFEAMGRPVGDRMARVDETAVDGSVPWSEVYGWRMMDPDGNFVGGFSRNEDFVAPGASTSKRPQIILRPADEFWDVSTPTETPVTEAVVNEAPPVASETPQVVNTATEAASPGAAWPPAPDLGRAVFDPASGRIVSLELPASAAAEPGFAEPVRAPTGPEVRSLSADQISGLTGAQLHAIKPEHLAKLTPEQVAALSPEQIGQLAFDQVAALRPKQLRALSAEQLQAIRPSRLQAIAPGRISGLRPDQVAALSPEQLAALTIEQVRKLTPDQIAGLSDEQRNAFSSEQFAAMRPAQFGHLDATQFAALNPDLVAARNPVTTAQLSPDHIAALTREQLGALTIHQIEALTKQQIAALRPKQLGELSPGQLRKFTPTQFAWMSTEQTNALSVLQVTTFRATHKNAMTPDQAAAVDQALSHARMRENAQALATFGGMSTTSYALWSSLPPTWTATAGAVAFGVRGFVFGTQAIFPNATASHKPFGRFLNALGGATFIAAAPGAATGMVQGKDLVVNSTFSLGNVVYGTKSMLQSFTGRPVIRNMAEHLAGPGYVLGCAVYTLHSWPAPIATVAGTMFTFGCAEFWASAIRTDRMNRRSVPRTDGDIAAAAKSDKRWAAGDRWTLGITFGIGMLLFSLDSLLAQPWDSPETTPPPDPKNPDGDASSQQPDDHPDVPDGPKTPPENFPQLVVLADDGLNLRAQPDGDSTVVTVLEPGTFVEQTAKPSTDPSGEAWIPVEGFGPDGEMHSGWVSSDLVEAHPAGSSNPEGRTNPTLEKDGYQWVEVKNGDSIRLIAKTHSTDVAETVVLNMDHILSPDMIFSGDRIYLPVTSVG
ncbi:hypothetical protein GCM10007880_00630 [Mesorhizobium amorphae]|nr:hypothetical protein GCM10007880_00630 [Mesorhizobium amorphae]